MARALRSAGNGDRSAVGELGGGSEPSVIDPTEFDKGGSSGGSDGDITVGGDELGGWNLGSGNAGTIPVKRRGRKPGSKNRTAAQVPLDVNGIEKLLYSCHMMLSGLTQTPELALSHEESNNMAAAAVAVSRHYDFVASQKMLDWGNLILVVGVTYGSKFAMVNARKRRERVPRNGANGLTAPNIGGLNPTAAETARATGVANETILAQLATQGKIPS